LFSIRFHVLKIFDDIFPTNIVKFVALKKSKSKRKWQKMVGREEVYASMNWEKRRENLKEKLCENWKVKNKINLWWVDNKLSHGGLKRIIYITSIKGIIFILVGAWDPNCRSLKHASTPEVIHFLRHTKLFSLLS
jgi:hypothetical protein